MGHRHVGLLVAHRDGAPYPGESLQAVLRALRSDARNVLPRFSSLLRSEGQRQSSS
jgi:hypothetical protein